MILDLGSDKRFVKIAKPIILSDFAILPICLGCNESIQEGKRYIVNDSGSLTHHDNGFCKELAEKNHISHYSEY